LAYTNSIDEQHKIEININYKYDKAQGSKQMCVFTIHTIAWLQELVQIIIV